MEESMLVNGEMELKKDKEPLHGHQDKNIKESLSRMNLKDKEKWSIPKEKHIKGIGNLVNKMEMVLFIKMDKYIKKEYGIWEQL